MTQHMIVKCRNQRCALSACGDVAAAEIADHRDTGRFGKQRGIADLHRIAVFRAVAYGLAVTAYRADLRRSDTGLDNNGKTLSEYSRASWLPITCARCSSLWLGRCNASKASFSRSSKGW